MKESQIAQIYEKYLWDKCSRTKYYERIRAWLSPFEALKPIPKAERYKRRSTSLKFKEEMQRYTEHSEPKVKRSVFYTRLYNWYTKEEAIKLDFVHKPKKLPIVKELYHRPMKTPIDRKSENQDLKEIRITYKSEEADIMRKQYEEMIEEVKNQILYADVGDVAKLNEKLTNLIQEYQTFISYNPNKNESM